jgi:septal ring factor EnvC (AmiA/AmiB activator)
MVALYKMNYIGRMNVMASADSVFSLFHRKFAMEKILAHDEKILTSYKNKKVELYELSEKLQVQKKEKRFLEQELRQNIGSLQKERKIRKKILRDIRNKKELGLASIKSLKQAAVALDKKLLSLPSQPKELDKTVFKRFEDYKGLLPMPVKGKIISFFGPYRNENFNVTNFRSGIEIKADMGEPVKAVMGGKVLYSDWFKNYGNMIIIDHGKHYHTIYAHAEELFKKKGELVEPDEVIATVGDTASMKGANLYFEIRHHGKPVNPLKWLKKG